MNSGCTHKAKLLGSVLHKSQLVLHVCDSWSALGRPESRFAKGIIKHSVYCLEKVAAQGICTCQARQSAMKLSLLGTGHSADCDCLRQSSLNAARHAQSRANTLAFQVPVLCIQPVLMLGRSYCKSVGLMRSLKFASPGCGRPSNQLCAINVSIQGKADLDQSHITGQLTIAPFLSDDCSGEADSSKCSFMGQNTCSTKTLEQ